MKDNAAYIEHCEKNIKSANEFINEIEDARNNKCTGELLDNLESCIKADKQIYETLLEDESQ